MTGASSAIAGILSRTGSDTTGGGGGGLALATARSDGLAVGTGDGGGSARPCGASADRIIGAASWNPLATTSATPTSANGHDSRDRPAGHRRRPGPAAGAGAADLAAAGRVRRAARVLATRAEVVLTVSIGPRHVARTASRRFGSRPTKPLPPPAPDARMLRPPTSFPGRSPPYSGAVWAGREKQSPGTRTA
jgi:hypothetical protein